MVSGTTLRPRDITMDPCTIPLHIIQPTTGLQRYCRAELQQFFDVLESRSAKLWVHTPGDGHAMPLRAQWGDRRGGL